MRRQCLQSKSLQGASRKDRIGMRAGRGALSSFSSVMQARGSFPRQTVALTMPYFYLTPKQTITTRNSESA